jgi:hypothetical protein
MNRRGIERSQGTATTSGGNIFEARERITGAMSVEKGSPNPSIPSHKEIVELCRCDVEAMHNLYFLLRCRDIQDAILNEYLNGIGHYLDHLTDILCRREH